MHHLANFCEFCIQNVPVSAHFCYVFTRLFNVHLNMIKQFDLYVGNHEGSLSAVFQKADTSIMVPPRRSKMISCIDGQYCHNTGRQKFLTTC